MRVARSFEKIDVSLKCTAAQRCGSGCSSQSTCADTCQPAACPRVRWPTPTRTEFQHTRCFTPTDSCKDAATCPMRQTQTAVVSSPSTRAVMCDTAVTAQHNPLRGPTWRREQINEILNQKYVCILKQRLFSLAQDLLFLTTDVSAFNSMSLEIIQYLAANKHKPEVVALARQAGCEEFLEGVTWPITRAFHGLLPLMMCLVNTGLDTDENLAILFGNCESVRCLQMDARIPVLMAEPERLANQDNSGIDPNTPLREELFQKLPSWQRSLIRGEEHEVCPLCSLPLQTPVQPLHGCQHIFHPRCIFDWLRRRSTCPVCKHVLPLHAARPATAEELRMVDAVQKMADRMSVDF